MAHKINNESARFLLARGARNASSPRPGRRYCLGVVTATCRRASACRRDTGTTISTWQQAIALKLLGRRGDPVTPAPVPSSDFMNEELRDRVTNVDNLQRTGALSLHPPRWSALQ